MEVVAAPVSFAQQGLWYQAELEPGNPAYHVPVALSLRGAIDRAALVAALDAIAARHEILRTTFTLDGAELLQVIHPRVSLPFREELVSDGDEELRLRIREEIHKPFDLVRGPLLRSVLFQRRDDEAVLLITMHHLVTDGWSLGVMVKELAAFYRRFVGSDVSPLADLEIQYADFAEWQRQQAGQAWSGQLEYWKQRLRGPLGRPELPADFPPSPRRTFEGATEAFRMPAATLDALRELARQTGSTLFMTLLAAFKVLVYRHTNVTDVVVGSPVANRNRTVEDLVGFFVNTQVLRTDLSGNPTFLEVLGRVRETTLGALENQDVPYELLTTFLQPERTREPSPFFQLMFALQNAPQGRLELPGVSVERMDVVTDTAKLAMTVITEEIDGQLELRIEYSTALFMAATVQRFGRRYERLLQAICAAPACLIDEMAILPDEETRLLEAWAGGRERFESSEPLHRWFERQVERTPERIALRCHPSELSYRQLNERANRLAHHLQALGVGSETLVGLCLDRSVDLVVAILAILKAGGAYVPLDPSYPANRLRFLIEDSGVPLVVTQPAHEGLLQGAGRLVVLDREEALISAQPANNPAVIADCAQAAYVIYTSGSTGRPKGVVVTHANVARLMSSTEALYRFGEEDVWTLFHSYAFDFSVWELWGALLYGGRLVVVPFSVSRTPEQFHRLLVEERVTVLNQTPSAFYQLMAFDAPSSLRYVIFGGEALEFQRLRGWFERHGDEHPQLINMYGITETTVHVTFRRVRMADLNGGNASVIGLPLPDLSAHVLDPAGRPMPIGVAGELYVGGAGVARGYLRRDELTAARFLERAGRRLYRSGDSARWLASGELEYLGRIDTQVKIRGFRIELGEIEHVLRTAAGVEDAVVVARPGPSEQQRLVAYCVVPLGNATTPNTLRAACQEQLPDYMVPAAYVLVDRFPLNANGKLDRHALPDPDLDQDVAHEAYVAPTNEIEATLARIWGEALQLERVGITDNFFALGGDSILLLQVAAKAAKAGMKLTRRNLVELQTIQELASVVKKVSPPPRAAAVAAPAPPVSTNESEWEHVYALTPLQQGLLFHSAYTPQQDFYIEQLHAELQGSLDLAAFQRAWETVIARHAALRTSFTYSAGDAGQEPRQRVARTVPFAIQCEDWRDAGADEQSARLQARLAEDRARGFDLSAAPLMRVAMFRLAGDRWHWLWTHHHLILDGWSLTAVVGEVLRCYRAFRNGADPQLEERRPFRDYIEWLGQQDVRAAEIFWRHALAGLAETTQLEALHRTDGATEERGELELALSEDVTARLQAWARHQQITLSTIVSAAWAKVLHTYGSSDDVVFGVTVSGRPAELAGYEQMVGPFINTLPLRVRIDRDAPLDAWLREVQKQHGRVREYEFSRLVDIQRWSSLPPGQPLFDTMVVFENYPVDASLREQESGLSFGSVAFVERGHYGLALAAIPGPQLALRLYYDGSRFDAATMRRVLDQLYTLLESGSSGAVGRVGSWSLLSPVERASLRSEPVRLDSRSPHELFEEWADRTPDRVALVLGDAKMTYGQLDARANALAHELVHRGAGPDVVVGLRLQRSFEAIVAVLAVWKAGGAYLPLDPAYPERRLAHMIEDSGASLILTERDLQHLDRSSERPRSHATSRNLAYVIYTSGSTGLPKGTLVERQGVTNLAHALAGIFSIDAESRVLQFASLSFDVSVSEIVMALCFGASLHLAQSEDLMPGPGLAALLRKRRITHLSIVPSALAAVPPVSLPDLRCLIVGGEPCPADLLAQWSQERQLFNCYGPTEATVCSTYSLYAGGRLTIGRAIANARTYILDAGGEPVPAGAPGELHIGGAGVARGYVQRPELTAKRFVVDPFTNEPGARLYRTGDLVRELPDGNLEFLGRADDQLKVRGFRIEPGEIAQVLRERGGLRDAAVIVRAGRIVAYCVATGSEITPRELRETCAEWLPEHMVPSAYVFIDALPLTASGKLDGKALPDPDLDEDVVRDAFVAPRTEVEVALAKAWSEVLGVARIGVADNFFELGGDSILSLQVVAKARQAGVDITPRQVFQHPTVAALAREARTSREETIGREALTTHPLTTHPLTPIQRWFFEQELVHRHHWNQAVLVDVASSVTDDVLEQSIAALAEHHDVFRSRFAGSRQVYASRGVIGFERVSLPADIEGNANIAQSSLDLEHGPLARAIHFTGEGGSQLLLVAHHLIVDGVSWRVLLEDLSRLCRGERLDPAVSFGGWAQHLQSSAKTKPVNIDYWLQLDGRDFRALPVDGPRDSATNRAGSIDIVELRLDPGETDALLRRVPAAYRTQVNDVLLAAFASAMRNWTGHDEVWVNLEGHGREALFGEIDLSRTAGWFTTLFPVRLKAESDDPGAALRSMKEQLRSIPDNGAGFGIARYLLGDSRLASLPSPEISFNYLGQFDQAEAAAGLFRLAEGPVGQGQSAVERRIHLLDVVASVQSRQFRVAWHYSRDMHHRATVERLAEMFLAALRRLIDHCVRLSGPGIEIEDIYALTPMQQGLLFHALQSSEPDLYVEQLQGELHGRLDAEAFERAWQEVIRRHEVFRTSFVWEGLDEPLQRVQREIEFRVEAHDWRDAEDRDERVAAYLAEDRRRGLALDSAPLFRVALMRLDEERWKFVWTHHHILLDGWCMNLVVREVLDCYQAITRGTAPPVRRSRAYRHYIDWLARQDGEAARKYWTRTLAGFTATTRLQLVEGSDTADAGSGQAELRMTALDTRRLQSWARRNHVTLSTLVTGAWARLLQTFSGAKDVTFGVTVSGRPASLPGSDEMIGLFINTLPLRTGDADGVPLHEWLQNLQSRQTELRDFEFSRLVDVQRWSDLPAGEPLFDTLLAFDNYPADHTLEQRFGDLEIHDARLTERTHYPITISIVPSDELRMRALYDGRRFAGQTVRQLLQCLETLLLAAASGEVRTAGEWRLISSAERQLLLERAGVEPPPVADECLGEWFRRVAAASPQSIALSFEGRSLTYAELERRSNQLAHWLQSNGAGPETLVGLCVERSPELIIGILGILKAGGAYVPLDPSNPADRLRFIARDSRLDFVVTHSNAEAAASSLLGEGSAIRLVSLDRDAEEIAKYPAEPPDAGVVPGNAAYVIYTSGSTGRPKGCIVTHANVSRLMKQTEERFAFDQSDVWTLFHSAAFDFSVWEIWGALLYGGRLVIVPYAVSRSPEQFYDLLLRERVTVLNQTPSAFRQLMAVDEARPARLDLRYVVFGGEALQFDTLRDWFTRHGDDQPLLVNMYGITETTVHVTWRPVRLADLTTGSRIGAPIADLKLYVLDPYQQLVPDGVVGELYVAGAGLSRGYLGHAALTAERMIPNSFGPGRLYRTGDLARRRGDDVEYLGRADEQVKVRGFRIEIGEIEAVLAQHPAVRETVVLMRPFDDGEKRLVAYVVGREPVTVENLRVFLGARIPDYMIPAAFVFLDALPLTSNGKIHRAALPAPSAVSGAAYAAPRNDAERALAAIWSEVLGVDGVGIHDNFFALGGDSIRSIQILSRARAQGFDYSFQELFAHPTIAELVSRATDAGAHEPAIAAFSLITGDVRAQLPSSIEDAYPLTRLQQGMFFHSDFEPGATAYHDVMSYHLRAPYDRERLAAALQSIAQRHPILRTSFDFTTFAEPLQLVHGEAILPLEESDVRGSSVPDALIREWIEHERRRPFDPSSAPLLRVHVHRRTGETFQLSLSFHHAILDGWSVATMLAELFRAYLGLPLSAPPSAAFRDFVALERRATGDEGERAFWRTLLEDAPAGRLPRLKAESGRPAVRQERIEISEGTSGALKELADRTGVPIRSLLLAAHVRALAYITNERDVVTGIVTNGRPEDEDGDRALGLFLNTVPFRIRLGGGSWIDLVRQTFAVEQQLNPHRRHPLAEIQKAAGGTLLFDTDFNFVHFHVLDEVSAIGGIESLGAEGFEETNFTMAVNFSWWGQPGRLAGALDYDASTLTDEQARTYARIYALLLESMALRPQERYETQTLPAPAFDFETAAITSLPLHELIAPHSTAVAVRDDDAVLTHDEAVLTYDEAVLTYDELQRRSNQLANALRNRGVGPDVLTGVALHPGIDRVVALLGVLKAGGAYLPLDPGYPAKRLAFLIEDSGMTHVITRPGVLDVPSAVQSIDVDWPGESDLPPAVSVRPDNLAYVLYTSGSTGTPKGVAITHRALVNHMQWMQRTYPLAPDDVVFQKTPFTFDASVWEFWAPLMSGASMHVAKAGGLQDPAYLIETIRRQGVTVLQVVPALLEALLAEPSFPGCVTLRRVFAGGEPLTLELVRRFHAAFPGAELVNLYGPTEATIDTVTQLVERNRPDGLVPIGRPVTNVRAYVLDDVLHFVPSGTEGDLYLAGEALGRGYLHQPGMTAASFVADPFGEPGTRMYRTGDRARWLPDGVLEFRGRADQQVKIRGHRIELAEVESALVSHEAIEQAVAASVDDRLVAYFVARAAVGASGLREHVRQLLPEHMVPSLFVTMERLPLTTSGKIDRQALPKPEAGDVASRAEFVAPSSEAERAVAAAWESVLKLDRAGAHDNFFDLGGDSILSLRIASQLRQAGWNVSPKLILQHQTVARVAAHIERVATAGAEEIVASGEVPLSPVQRAFFERNLPNPNHWNQSVKLDVPPDFSAEAFERALDAVARHHDAFRLRFNRDGREWRQQYGSEPARIPLDFTSDVDHVQASLDIAHGPLMRAALFDGHLLLVAHHLVVDGVSWRILFEDLTTAYEQALRDEPILLPQRTASLRTWVRQLESRAANADPSHWLALAALDVQTLGGGEPHGNLERDARSLVVHLDDQDTRALIHELPRRTHARVTELLLAALTEVITDWTGNETLWIDVEGHGREELFDGVDVSRTVGWFTSVFPVALRRANGVRSMALLDSVKAQWRAIPDHGIDFGLLRYLSPDESLRQALAALPGCELSFNYLGRFDEANRGPFRPSSAAGGADHDPDGPRQSLLDVNARVVGERLTIEWTYASGVFDESAVEALSAAFVACLRRLASSGATSVAPSDFPLVRVEANELSAFAASYSDIEDILPLSPLQEGLLFHALDDEQRGVYVQQITAVLEGDPNREAFERAWNRTIERHPVLRTSFHRRELERPLQIVHQEARCAVTWLDWRSFDAPQQAAMWEALLREDRQAGIDLEQAPLMRVTVARTGERRSQLLWTHHHLILDGWSLPIVLRDLVSFYREAAEGVAAMVAPAPAYTSFIAWLQERDQGEARAFWKNVLDGFERPNELALPRPSGTQTAAFDAVERVFSQAFTARLAALAQQSRVTLNTVVQTMWALLCSTYSRQDDVVFGVTVSGRPDGIAGIDQTAGLFINTLPLRVQVRPEQPLGELLQEVQRRQSALSQFEFTPLVEVQRCSAVPPGRALFDTIFVFENYPLGESLDDAPLADFSVGLAQSVEWTHYPLTCYVTPSRELRLKLVFDTGRFEQRSMEQMLEHAADVLEAFIDRPDQNAGTLAAAKPVRRIAAAGPSFERFFHERFAERTPNACAVAFDERALSYGELDVRSNRLANHLRSRGVGPDEVAAVFMDRSPEMIVALLAILKAGGAYLPLDPRFPRERLEMMVADGRPRVLVTEERLVSRLPRHDAGVLCMDGDWPEIEREPAQAPVAGITPENLAYVIFTSGSTGRPKGVQIPHRALVNLLASFERRPGMTPDDVMLAVTTLSFDIAALELFLPLMCGARLVIASADEAADGDRLNELLRKHGVTVMQATPATWRLLLLSGWKPASSLRIWCGGEAMPPDLADELRANGSEVWNVYGPTETTIWSAIHRVSGSGDARLLDVPVANTTLSVVDTHLNPLPFGVAGELLIGGEGVARGYRNQPGLTAERFVPDPFEPGARAYRTGDQVRLHENGALEFLGRDDTQVKIRGFRVELGEIEAALRRIDEVRDAVVVFRDGRLIGYVVRAGRSDLSQALRQTLPDYMVPAVWVELEALPLTPNGKVDRNALPRPEASAQAATLVRPRTPLEEVLAAVWKDTLGVGQVGIDDNFFALGGHSLHAAQIVAWLRRAFHSKIPLRILFEASTIERLAAVLTDQHPHAAKTADALLKIRKMSPEERARRLQQRQSSREEAVE